MDKFEQKYGIEDNKVEAFHKGRRMFCIYQGQLVVADENLPYSHAAWFEKEGWMTKEQDKLMEEIPRGIIDSKGDIYFYVGYDFKIDNNIEAVFFSHFKELVEKLNLNPNAKIFGGLVKSEPGSIWPAIKDYGQISENMNIKDDRVL
jgi:hypothetical protein